MGLGKSVFLYNADSVSCVLYSTPGSELNCYPTGSQLINKLLSQKHLIKALGMIYLHRNMEVVIKYFFWSRLYALNSHTKIQPGLLQNNSN